VPALSNSQSGNPDAGSSHRWALIVEDDPNDLDLASEVLRREGFAVMGAGSASRARELLGSRAIDLCILDLGLEDANGLELLVEVRQRFQMPLMVSTGQADVETAVVSLRLGADDHLVKPYPPALFAARVAALMRRSGADHREQVLQFDELRIDLSAREITLEGVPVVMPAREFDVLAFLATHPRQVFSRRQLLEQVWESSPEWQDEATVTEHIRKIRLRIESDARTPRWISTIRRVGYRFNG
jgi:DNA-binding response OmpR family regulator